MVDSITDNGEGLNQVLEMSVWLRGHPRKLWRKVKRYLVHGQEMPNPIGSRPSLDGAGGSYLPILNEILPCQSLQRHLYEDDPGFEAGSVPITLRVPVHG